MPQTERKQIRLLSIVHSDDMAGASSNAYANPRSAGVSAPVPSFGSAGGSQQRRPEYTARQAYGQQAPAPVSSYGG